MDGTAMKTLRSTALGAALLALAACASTPPPMPEMAVANAALAHAVAAGSAELAPVEMAMARDKLARANLALAAGKNDSALMLAQQVQLDAQLAEAKAESEKASRSAAALRDAARALREEMARQPK
jgi:Domain of unknown function (DUF4398)